MTDEEWEPMLKARVDRVRQQSSPAWKDELGWEDHFVAGANAARELCNEGPPPPPRGRRPNRYDHNKYEILMDGFIKIKDNRMSPGIVKIILDNTLAELEKM